MNRKFCRFSIELLLTEFSFDSQSISFEFTIPLIFDFSSDDEAEDEADPVVVVNNKPLTKIENSGSQITNGQSVGKKKKKKKNKDQVNDSAVASTSLNILQQADGKQGENKEHTSIESKQQSSKDEPATAGVSSEKDLPKQESVVTELKQKSKPVTPEQKPKQASKQQPKKALKSQPNAQSKPQPKQKSKPGASQKQSNSVGNKSSIDKFKAKHNNPLKKVANKVIDKKNKTNNANKQKGLSDERLKAFGINPKKFNKQQKYVSHIAQKNAANKTSPLPKRNDKLGNKLAKALQKK